MHSLEHPCDPCNGKDQTELIHSFFSKHYFWSVHCFWQTCCSILPSITLKTASESPQCQTCVRYAALNSFLQSEVYDSLFKKAIIKCKYNYLYKKDPVINRSIVLVIFAILKYYLASQLTWKCFRVHWRRMKWRGKWGLQMSIRR